MKFKVIAENGAEKEFDLYDSYDSELEELERFLKENQLQEDVFKIIPNEKYFYIFCNDVKTVVYSKDDFEPILINNANACKDKELMEKRALNETLNRLMWRFSMQNGGREIDWKSGDQTKYCIDYDFPNKLWSICSKYYYRPVNAICFKNYKTAERCIEEVIKPFLAEHPDFEPNVY